MPIEQRRITIEGAELETLAWGDSAAQGLLLIHGSMAHARWWEPVAQLLAKHYRVVSFSFSGMGGSDWRIAYSVQQMAREIIGVAEATRLFADGRRPALIAHSFGGQAATFATHSQGDRLLGAVMVDSFLSPEPMPRPPLYKARSYASLADALERFRFSPNELGAHPYIIDAIARASVICRDGQWTWRFDPDFFAKCTLGIGWDELVAAPCPLAFVRGESSTVALKEDFDLQRRAMRADSIFLEIPQANHHIMAQQPIALFSALQAIIEGWRGLAGFRPRTAATL